jgi:putative ABC transport system substrate-binding protein
VRHSTLRTGTPLAIVFALLLGAVSAVQAQPPEQTPRIGVLTFTQLTAPVQESLRQGLRDHGYVEGQNLRIEWRAAEGRPERAKAQAAELVQLKVDVIVANLTPAVQAAKEATGTIPIVMASAGNPVGTGFVKSLSRPGGNITGLTGISAELAGKRVELLRELIPGLTRVGFLVNGSNPFAKSLIEETRAAAKRAGVELQIIDVRRAADIEPAFAALKMQRTGGVIVDAALTSWKAAELGLQYRVPSISNQRHFVEAGGLMFHGAEASDVQRRAAGYVARILKGASPAELPVEQPTKFELVLNLRTAKALGLTIAQPLLVRATETLE